MNNITHIHSGKNNIREDLNSHNPGQNLHNINYPNTSYREILGVIAASFMVVAAFAVIICIIYDFSSEKKPALNAPPPSYLSSLKAGHQAGYKDGERDQPSFGDYSFYQQTLWYQCEQETARLKEKIKREEEEYLSQFEPSKRLAMLALRKKNNVKSADEILLENRFTSSKEFYIDYINSQQGSAADVESLQILADKAWLLGYEYGYAVGKIFMNKHYKMFE